MFPDSKLSVNTQVGDFVTILSSGVGHDVRIGDYSTISGLCSLVRDSRIGNEVFVGSNVVINKDIHVGDNSYIGAGSVVLKDVPANSKVFGNPARIVPQ
jgi:acetyltransferase-like isoleucine patch superfamily enzyme